MEDKKWALRDLEGYARIVAVEIIDFKTIPTNESLIVGVREPARGILGKWFGRSRPILRGMRGWRLEGQVPWDCEVVVLGWDGRLYATSSGTHAKKAVVLTEEFDLSLVSIERVKAALQSLDEEHLRRRS